MSETKEAEILKQLTINATSFEFTDARNGRFRILPTGTGEWELVRIVPILTSTSAISLMPKLTELLDKE
jgi:hypothetical protein